MVYFRRRDVYDLHHAILGDDIICSYWFVRKTSSCTSVAKEIYFNKNIIDDKKKLVNAGLFFSVLVTAVITDSIKNAVGRPRPDFFWRCFPDGKDVCFPDWQFFNVLLGESNVSFSKPLSDYSINNYCFLRFTINGEMLYAMVIKVS